MKAERKFLIKEVMKEYNKEFPPISFIEFKKYLKDLTNEQIRAELAECRS